MSLSKSRRKAVSTKKLNDEMKVKVKQGRIRGDMETLLEGQRETAARRIKSRVEWNEEACKGMREGARGGAALAVLYAIARDNLINSARANEEG